MQQASHPIAVMIADDHELIRVGIKKIVRACRDMQFTGEAADRDSLLTMLDKQLPDVLILDINLPPYDDLAGLLEVRRKYPGLAVLMLSMYPEERYAVPAIRNGASGYITKSMAADELVTAIRKIVAGGPYISPRVAELLAAEVRQVHAAPAPAPAHRVLTSRERQIALCIAAGKAPKQIAAELELSVSSVNTYRARILRKLDLQSNAALIRYVIEEQMGEQA